MIRRLRVKFVCVNMAIALGMLCAIFATVLHFTRLSLASESLRSMEEAAVEPMGLRRPGEARLPCFTLRLGYRGELVAAGDGFYDLSDEAYLRRVLAAALETGQPSGVLEEDGLRFCRTGPPDRQVLVFADVSGERRTMEGLVRTCLLIGGGSLAAFLLISLLLARWAVRPVERAWEQQRQFVADASHELKTPLTVILTNAELLQEEDGGRFAANILTMARQMRELVECLLELARVDGGLPEAAMERLDFSRLVSEAVLPFEPLFFEAGLTLECQVAPHLEVRGSAQRLRQAAEVLLDNAQKYTITGGTVVLRLERRGRSCVLSVFSPGEPLSGEELRNVFKRFCRGDGARSRGGGYGLGLAIAEGIVSAHRGRIWAEGGAGGTTFFIRLPLESD
ncbi:MAG: HAMP domain-containing histidine kinase [Oscillospiraceae bacterium]|nr:HAMP domain-containing histidine kinase [Oscillospiraceae bacterium]